MTPFEIVRDAASTAAKAHRDEGRTVLADQIDEALSALIGIPGAEKLEAVAWTDGASVRMMQTGVLPSLLVWPNEEPEHPMPLYAAPTSGAEKLAEEELRKIATTLGEPDDPFSAWETLSLILNALRFYADPEMHQNFVRIEDVGKYDHGFPTYSMVDRPGLYRIEAPTGYVVPLIFSDGGALARSVLPPVHQP